MVLSIFIMFGNDRLPQLEATLDCLSQMDGFEGCQKTLVVDGPPRHFLPGWSAISVPRIGGKFCWANMWAAGVATARHDGILYLDSDRLLPQNYLRLVRDRLRDDDFLFTSRHFMVLKDLPWESCREFLEEPELGSDRIMGALRYEARHRTPVHGPGKNVMSGNTAFTKATFLRLGGVDPWYCGHGAFADTDFHLQAAQSGCTFTDLGVPELHCHHVKRDDGESQIDEKTLRLLGLDNFVYYCTKWNLPLALAEGLAGRIGVPYPARHIRKRLEVILGDTPAN